MALKDRFHPAAGRRGAQEEEEDVRDWPLWSCGLPYLHSGGKVTLQLPKQGQSLRAASLDVLVV